MTNQKVIGKKLRMLRGSKQRKEVDKCVKISVSALSMYENGERMPRDEIKVALAEYYNANVGELFFEN